MNGKKLPQNISYPHTGVLGTHKRFREGKQISPHLDTATAPCTSFSSGTVLYSSCAITAHEQRIPTGVNVGRKTDTAVFGVL